MPKYTNARTSITRADILAAYPNRTAAGHIVRWGSSDEADLAHAFGTAAKRLGDSVSGAPEDDVILMPFLANYRQALELSLKSVIKYVSRARDRAGHVDSDYPLAAALVDRRVRYKHGHRLDELVSEVNHHLSAIGVERLPADTLTVITRFHEADGTGTGFRYDGLLPNERDDIEFPDLARELADALMMVQVSIDLVYDQFVQGLEALEQEGP